MLHIKDFVEIFTSKEVGKEMNSKLRTTHYTIINVAYFAAFSGVHAYAAVFLIDSGKIRVVK